MAAQLAERASPPSSPSFDEGHVAALELQLEAFKARVVELEAALAASTTVTASSQDALAQALRQIAELERERDQATASAVSAASGESQARLAMDSLRAELDAQANASTDAQHRFAVTLAQLSQLESDTLAKAAVLAAHQESAIEAANALKVLQEEAESARVEASSCIARLDSVSAELAAAQTQIRQQSQAHTEALAHVQRILSDTSAELAQSNSRNTELAVSPTCSSFIHACDGLRGAQRQVGDLSSNLASAHESNLQLKLELNTSMNALEVCSVIALVL